MKKGFTLVELLLTIGIFAIIATLTSINFFSTYAQSNLGAAEDVLIADIKSAQSNAMAGKGSTNWSVIIPNPNSYVMMPDNFTTTLQNGITISTSLASNKLEFARISGEIVGYIAGQDTITLANGGNIKTIRLNQYGTIIGQ